MFVGGGVRGGGVRRLLIVSKVKVQCSSGVLLNDKEVKLPMLKKSLSPARIFLEINHMRKYRVVVHTVQLDFKRLRKTFTNKGFRSSASKDLEWLFPACGLY